MLHNGCMPLGSRLLLAFSFSCVAALAVSGQTGAPAKGNVRPMPPTRDPHTPGYVNAAELPDGSKAPVNTDGNFILGPTHTPAPEIAAQEGVPKGTIVEFTMHF